MIPRRQVILGAGGETLRGFSDASVVESRGGFSAGRGMGEGALCALDTDCRKCRPLIAQQIKGSVMDDKAVIYLDTQDYSKFAEARLGRGHIELLDVLNELLSFKNRGSIIFAYSFPLLSELLQFSENDRELIMQKAKIVEELCDNNAFYHPNVVVIKEVRQAAQSTADHCLVSDSNRWFPTAKSMFKGLEKIAENKLDEELKKRKITLNRARRRKAKKILRPQVISKFAREYASTLAKDYPLSEKFFAQHLADALSRKIPYPELDRLFYAEAQKPSNFLHAYFTYYQEKAALPLAMRSFGEKIVSSLQHMKVHVQTIVRARGVEFALNEIKDFGSQLAETMIDVSKQETETVGWNEKDFERTINNDLHKSTIFYSTFSKSVQTYLIHNLGIYPQAPRPKISDGGDLMHLVYLPHATLWRSDARFCETVSQACPEHRKRIVRKITQLPEAVAAIVDSERHT